VQHPNKEIMRRAIQIAKDNYKTGGHAVAAIITKDDKIIAKAYTTVEKNQDATCHAEINVIRLASKELNSKYLQNCYLYSTFEPCPMCAAACVWARIKGIVYGANIEDSNKKYPQRINISCEKVINKGDPQILLIEEFMREECKPLLNLGIERKNA